ncbi:hypothetical protein FACS18948_5310 [Clostridia bacterium]|nr:hypothetical protein FACS18948_5310 [Clostridia bacterium]
MKHSADGGLAFRLMALVCALVLLLTFGVTTSGVTETVAADAIEPFYGFTDDDSDVSIPADATHIAMNEDNIAIDGLGATVSGSVIFIDKAGTYVLSGSTTNRYCHLTSAQSKKTPPLDMHNLPIQCT